MAINPTLKLASIAIGAGGVVTGGAIGIYNHINKPAEGVKEHIEPSSKAPVDASVVKKAVSEWLKGTNLELLSETDNKDQAWTPKWELFKREHTTDPTGDWKIENWTTVKENDTGFDKFKGLCLTHGQKEIEETNPILEKIKKYCTKSTSPTP
ncbi:hypothetical protein A6V39_01195 [Candidatus Mycoplasma haematobovis]|uniref:Uncharacterized protein n=1 Tax=Candidatus Mycoplasma haematobovis TaxID=432608 RepID=A0A1A9QG12_9MOLU|nr:hypothetical protein [Candidatus Mycoplasma haematobovis]OAL10669.1 hypothetical protein A6V39_01195 [Candidatus Mycoplasma haematobovis]